MMLGSTRRRAGAAAVDILRKRISAVPSVSILAATLEDAVVDNSQQQRWYSQTTVLSIKKQGFLYKKQRRPQKKKYTDVDRHPTKITDRERRVWEIGESMPDITSYNRPPDMTDEDIYKLAEECEEQARQEEAERWVPNWKPGMRRRPLIVSYREEDFDLDRPRWTSLDRRCGLLALKIGMMPVFDDWGERIPCTVLHVEQNVVLGHKTMDKHNYLAVQVAAGQRKRKNVSKALMNQYTAMMEAVGTYEHDHPPYLVREFRVTDESHLIPLHTALHARHFIPGQNVDIAGISKGKGFAGGMKRHNFKGMPATHGVSKSHRSIGATGNCTTPGRVFKGKKMPGRMGGDRVTVQNVRVIQIDRGRNLLYVKGQVPGMAGGWCEIRDAIKKPLFNTDLVEPNDEGNPPVRPPLPTFSYDPAIDGIGEAGHLVKMPTSKKDPLNYTDEEEAA